MSALFSKPKLSVPTLPNPPSPAPQNTDLQQSLQQLGRRQGLVAAMFGYRNPSGPSGSKRLTGE